jgi:hypothetical protein
VTHAARSGGDDDLSSGERERERALTQEKSEARQGMDAATDYEAVGAFYRAEEGGETMSWKRNSQRRVEFFNTSVSGRREEGATSVPEWERSTHAALGSHTFLHVGLPEDAAARRRSAVGVRRRLD